MIHILHHQKDEIVGWISRVKQDSHKNSIQNEESYDFIASVSEVDIEKISSRSRILIPDEEGDFREFIVDYIHDRTAAMEKQVYTKGSFYDIRKLKVIKPQTLEAQTIQTAAGLVLSGLPWEVGIVEYSGIRKWIIENHLDAYEALKAIASLFECEIRFRVTVDGDTITGRYVDFIKRQGLNRGKETVFGKDLINITRKVFPDRIITALHCLGPEKQDGTRLEVIVTDNAAYQNWNWKGHHLIEKYEPESSDQDMTLERLKQLGEAELKKRITAAVEYEVDAASLEHIYGYEHEIVRLGDGDRIKDEHFNPPMYLDSRVVFVDRSVFNKSKKTFKLGEVIEYKKEDVMKTWRELQALYATKVIKSPTAPPGNPNVIWIKTGGSVDIPHTWNATTGQWEKMSPTEAEEVGSYTQTEVDTKDQSTFEDGTYYADETAKRAEERANGYTEEKLQEAKDYAEPKIPDTLPAMPPGVKAEGGFKSIFVDWDFVSENYISKYQVYGSETNGFTPSASNLLFEGKTDSFAHSAGNNKTFFYKVRAVNVYGKAGPFCTEVSASTVQVTTDEILFGAITAEKIKDLAVDAAKLADLSVTDQKLVDGAVIQQKIASLAVDGTKIASGAVNNPKLANLAVTAEKLASGAVTNDKIENSAVDNAKLDALAVEAENMADGSVITQKLAEAAAEASKIASNAVTNPKLASLAVDAEKLASGSVTNTKINNLAVNNAKLDALAVDAAKLADGAATETKLGAGSVTNAKIGNLAVTEAKIGNLAVTSGKVANLAVGNAAIANGAITNAKIGNLAVDTAQLADAAITSGKIANLAVGTAAIQDLAVTNAKISQINVDKLASVSPNLIPDGWDTIDQLGLGKNPAGAQGNLSECLVSNEYSYIGRYSLKTVNNNANSYKYIYDHQTMLVAKPGENWIVSAYALRPYVGTTATVEIHLVFRDSAYAWILEVKDVVVVGDTNLDWTRLKCSGIAPANTAYVTCYVRTVDSVARTVFWDAFQIEKASDTSQKEPSSFKPKGTTIIDGGNITAQTVTASQMAANSITAANGAIANLAVTTAKIADLAVTNAKIANLAVDTAQIASAAITDAKIANLAVGTAAIKDLAVTNAKISEIAAEKILVGDFTNYADGSDFEDATRNPWNIAGLSTVSIDSAQFHSGSKSLKMDKIPSGTITMTLKPMVKAEEGDVFYIEFWVLTTVDWNGDGNAKMRFGDAANSHLISIPYGAPSTTWRKVTATPTISKTTLLTIQLWNTATAGTIWIDDIVIKKMTGGQLIVNGTISANHMAVNSITAANGAIANLAVESAKIANLAVGTAAIANLAVTNAKIGNLAVNTAQITDLAISNAKVGNLAVDNGKIGNLAVTEAKIANLAVTNAKIANLAVDDAKIKDLSAEKLKANSVIAQDITFTGKMTAAADTTKGLSIESGNIVEYNPGGNRTLLGLEDTLPSLYSGNLALGIKPLGYGKLYTHVFNIWVPAKSYSPGDYVAYTFNLKNYDSVAIALVMTVQATALSKEWYVYEEQNGRVFEGADLKSIRFRVSPHYAYTSGGTNVEINLMVLGYR
ncbi:hypothetical protein LIT38_20345 [Bacillus sp. CMF12]|uniref:phage tail spike protein n=1 Tax=Bacillus sp. CMF12 TaxID=2884834 RepID=UPI00207AF50E|nr:phage tail spike protein [Bacillus sp. CMF12]USK48862.1 hypothetical protein LIT38_20345 [Bacillus sp. CMF12]